MGMAEMVIREHQGLYERVYSLFSIVGKLRENISEEETEGILKLLPTDTYRALRSMLRQHLLPATFPFMRMLQAWMDEAARAREEGKKVILVPFNFPPELIHAFEGAFPLTSEVLSTLGVVILEGQGERYWDYAMGMGLPDHMCSSNTIELGSVLTGKDFAPDAIVSSAPGSCDVNSSIHEFVSHLLGVPHFMLEKPGDSDRRGRELFGRHYLGLVRRLEEFVGEELKEERLRDVAEKCNECTDLYYDLWELRSHVPTPVPAIFALYTYATRFTMWGRQPGVDCLKACVDLARENLEKERFPAGSKEAARPLWIYLPYFFDFLGFFDWMESRNIANMGDVLMCCFPQRIDTSSRESILDGMAEAAWNMPMTRQMGGDFMSRRWLDDVVYAVKGLNADCTIYCGHHSCKQTWSVFSQVRNEITRQAGVPTLCLQGDSWIRRMTPMAVIQEEISAFVDNVMRGGRRKREGRRSRRERPAGSERDEGAGAVGGGAGEAAEEGGA
jgi:benzoyl-CoA reductase/2-hydroxyglutaryl-CoA dehydratase subunit BcrC/BadD/HgdB